MNKMLNGMAKKPLKGIPESDLYEVGHYIDHELVSNIEKDVNARIKRINNNEPIRILTSVGGAGAGAKSFLEIVNHLLPLVKENKASLFINLGDHLDMFEFLKKKIPGFGNIAVTHFDNYQDTKEFVSKMEKEVVKGVHIFYHNY